LLQDFSIPPKAFLAERPVHPARHEHFHERFLPALAETRIITAFHPCGLPMIPLFSRFETAITKKLIAYD